MNKQCFQLFASFFKIGAFTFGGGWAMISIIEKEIVEKKKWIEKEEFLDLLAIAQSLPGILAVNISVAVGDKIKGKIGSMGRCCRFCLHHHGFKSYERLAPRGQIDYKHR